MVNVNLLQDAARAMGVHAFPAYDQRENESCIAASIAYGVLIYVALHTAQKVTEPPSVHYAYHAMRKQECRTTRACTCEEAVAFDNEVDACGGPCDAKCGGLVAVGIDAFRRGVPPESAWPPSKSGEDRAIIRRLAKDATLGSAYMFRCAHDSGATQPLSFADVVDTLTRKRRGVVLNLALSRAQQDFFLKARNLGAIHGAYGSVPSGSGPSGSGSGPSGSGSGPSGSVPCRFPAPGPAVRAYGHCVLVFGVLDGGDGVLVRNSFGPKWGCSGDFVMGPEHFTAAQIYEAVII